MTEAPAQGRARKTRVLFLPILFYPEPWNGIMEHLRLVISGLDRDRFEPLLATRPDDGEQTATLAARAEVRTCALGLARDVGSTRALCRSERVDIVHVHTPVTSSVTKMALGARLARVPSVIVTYHQVQPWRLSSRSRLVNLAGQRLLSSRTVAVSGGVVDTLAANAGLDCSRITVIHNGIAPFTPAADPRPSPFTRAPGEVWAGYFGRLADEKGLRALLDAVALARADASELRLLISGEGYERAALEAQARELGIEDSVVFAGQRDDVRVLMREVDFVVHVPKFEGFGLALIEAMEATRAVVATNVPGGIPELVRDGENGLLVPLGDIAALAGALMRVARDAVLRDRLAAAGHERYERDFRADVMVRKTLALYERGSRD